MNMNWLESMIYGLISGVSEFLPISSPAHQQLMMHLFGIDARDPVRDLFVHIAMLIAVIVSSRPFLEIIKRDASSRRGRHAVQHNVRALCDWRVIQGAVLPMLILILFLRYVFKSGDNLMITGLFMVINGIILFLPERMVQGNKDARSMAALDSILIGSSGALSVFCGISRIGCTYGVAVARGAAKKHALTWSLILSIYALACLCLIDLITVFSFGHFAFWESFFTYLLSGAAAFCGSCVSIAVMRFLTARPGSGFAYYCWGASLFSLILFLTVG